MSGHICSQNLSDDNIMMKVYLKQRFDGVLIAFDLNNLKSLNSLNDYFKLITFINQTYAQGSLLKTASEISIESITSPLSL